MKLIFNEFFSSITHVGAAVVVLTIALALIAVQLYKRVNAYRVLAIRTHYNLVFPQAKLWHSGLKFSLLAAGFIFLCISLAGPKWGIKKEQELCQGREVFIILDISRSMLAEDIKPSRLECAKQKIKDLVEKLHSERVGLILFSGTAIVQCPLTTDKAAFNLFLNNVDAQTISLGTTAVDEAIKKALVAFKNSGSGKNKIVVLFTDGEDFSNDLHAIKQHAAQEKLHIFAVGIGTETGAPVPVIDAQGSFVSYQQDENNQVVISRVNHGILTNLAFDCGGKYIRFSANDADITAIATCLEQYEKELFASQEVECRHERYYIFALLSFVCFVLEWVL